MPPKLTERPEEQVRQFLTTEIRPTEIEGYDPQQTDTTATDFLPVITDWSSRGDYYPIISVRETNGPTIPDSGNTNYNSFGQDGPNQFSIYPITVSCQAVQEGAYLNGVDAEELVQTLYEECKDRIQNSAGEQLGGVQLLGMTPPTVTRSTEEPDNSDSITWLQYQGTANVSVIDTP